MYFCNLKTKLLRQKGVTLYIALAFMSLMLLTTFAIVNMAVKSTLFSSLSRESQKAILAADSGVECAVYWDSQPNNPFLVKMSTFADYYVTEFSGVERNSTPLEKRANKTGILNGVDNPETVYSESVNLVYPEQLIIGWFQESRGQQVEVGPGFTSISPLRWNRLEYKTVTSGGSQIASALFTNPYLDNSDYMASILTFKAAAGETPTMVQQVDGYITMPNPVQLTLPNPSASGNFILVNISYDSGTFNVGSVTDNKGNTYVKAYGPYLFPFSPWASEVWYAKNIIGTVDPERLTVTVNSPAFVPTDLVCEQQTVTSGLGTTNDVSTNPAQRHRLGGTAAENNPEKANRSIFQLNFDNGTCAIVRVDKDMGQPTVIYSRGYNTCNTSNSRRVERGVEVRY